MFSSPARRLSRSTTAVALFAGAVVLLCLPAACRAATISGAGSGELTFTAASGQSNNITVREIWSQSLYRYDRVEFKDDSGSPILDDGPGGCTIVHAAEYYWAYCPVDLQASTTFIKVDSGDGDDTVSSEINADNWRIQFVGGSGNDELSGRAKFDRLFGCAGNDKLTGGGNADYLAGDGGIGPNGVTYCAGSSGDDTLDGGSGADTLEGGPGSDTASWADSLEDVKVRLDGIANDGGRADRGSGAPGTDFVSTDIENVTTGKGDDRVYGNDGANVIRLGVGKDRARGYDGDDTLNGGSENDRLYGDEGNDTVDYSGGLGINVDLDRGRGESRFGASFERDRLMGVENVSGSPYDDELRGDEHANRLLGQQGADRLYGLGGADLLAGGLDNDTMEDLSPEPDTFRDTFGPMTGSGADLVRSRDGRLDFIGCGARDANDAVIADPIDITLTSC